ncbi:MAG TPA: dTDP-4-dehydrorhamnose reductase [Galbitalea sp.]|jgi:dTDP-4-dehydrorhamnose reductase|nr:dTDP-4-dehydrorhamnose reductase [Galbitalea sp.]
MVHYLITGAGGMLGHDLATALGDRDVVALTRADLDVTDLESVRAAVDGADVVINAAAYTRVDDAESEEEEAFAINATGAGNVAIAAAEASATLVHYSTDYVFDGTAATPYREYHPTNPVTAYGRTKAAGERLVIEHGPERTFLLRIAYLYGEHGPNFTKTMLRLASQRETVSVVTDQVGQPTWTADVAEQTLALLGSDAAPGIYHATNSGSASWFEFARAIFETAGLDPERVLPTDSEHYVQRAPRPRYSVLGHRAWEAAGIPEPRDWREALHAAAERGIIGPR